MFVDGASHECTRVKVCDKKGCQNKDYERLKGGLSFIDLLLSEGSFFA